MLQDIHFQYKGACMMLFQREGNEVSFRGTAFLVHPDGYLLTAAHLVTGNKRLMVAPMEEIEAFTPVGAETVTPYPVTVKQLDRDRDLALLKFEQETEVSMPPHVMGAPGQIPVGQSTACIGFPFGYYYIYNQIIQQGVICAKFLSKNGTRLFLFDAVVHDGSRGAPLINVYDGRIIGVVGGRFEPQEILPERVAGFSELPIKSFISYAVSIDHAVGLMEKEDLAVI